MKDRGNVMYTVPMEIGETGRFIAKWTLGITGSNSIGAQGSTGINGIQGETGVGAKGDAGLQGITGISIVGDQGSTGLQGITGISIVGDQGSTGLQGITGIGIQGTTGLNGIEGSTGLQGATGVSLIGLQGATGIDVNDLTSYTSTTEAISTVGWYAIAIMPRDLITSKRYSILFDAYNTGIGEKAVVSVEITQTDSGTISFNNLNVLVSDSSYNNLNSDKWALVYDSDHYIICHYEALVDQARTVILPIRFYTSSSLYPITWTSNTTINIGSYTVLSYGKPTSQFITVTTSAQLEGAISSYYISNIWVANDITLTLSSTSLYIRSQNGKTIEGPGIITIVGDSTNTVCNVYGSTDPVSNDVAYMSNAVVDFKCKTSITQYFRCHVSTFWFRRCTSSIISSSVLYGIWADSSTTIHYGFSDNGYVGVFPAGVSSTVIFDGCEGKQYYSDDVLALPIIEDVTLYPMPNAVYNATVTAITITLMAPMQENFTTCFGMKFYIKLAVSCGSVITVIFPDPSGTSVTAYYRCSEGSKKGYITVEQLGSGYILPLDGY